MGTLYSDAGIHVSRAKNTVLVVRDTKYYDLALSGVITLGMLFVAALFTAAFVGFSREGFRECLAGDLGALFLLGFLGFMMIGMSLSGVLMALRMLVVGLPREFFFDLHGQVCWKHHLPGLDRSIPLDTIESFDLVPGYIKGWYVTWLCLKESGKKRYLCIAEISRQKQPQNGVFDELRAVGEILSGEVGRPLKTQERCSPWKVNCL